MQEIDVAIEMWQLNQYQGAAVDMCNRIGVDPFEQCDSMMVNSPQVWTTYALRMAEFKVMIDVMRNFGLAP